MNGVSEYKGIANPDIRPVRGGARPDAPSGRGEPMVFSVEEFRNGINIGGGAAESSPEKSAEEENAPPKGRYRGRNVVPRSYLAAHSDRGQTEAQRVAKLQKIRESALEYEGMLMNEMVKCMRQSSLVKTPGSETYSEIAEKPFTAALTAAGGLGLADKIVEDVARQEGLLGTLSEHPEIMGPNWTPKISPSRMFKPANMNNLQPQSLRRAPDLKAGEPEKPTGQPVEDSLASGRKSGIQTETISQALPETNSFEASQEPTDPVTNLRLNLLRESLQREESERLLG